MLHLIAKHLSDLLHCLSVAILTADSDANSDVLQGTTRESSRVSALQGSG